MLNARMSGSHRQSRAPVIEAAELTLNTVNKGTRKDSDKLLDNPNLCRLQRHKSARGEAVHRARIALLLYRCRVAVTSLDESLRRRARECCDDISDRFLDLLDEGQFRRR